MSRKIAKFGPKKSSKRPFYTVKLDRHYFWDAPFRTIPKLVLLLLKWYSNYDSSPCNALLRTFLIWSTYERFYDPKMTQKCGNLIFLRYTHIVYMFWTRMDSTQWDDKLPISWGNSGYLRFSGRWPFGRSAGRFMAPIAQSGPFGPKSAVFWPEMISLWTVSKKIVTIMTGHLKDNLFVLTALQGGLRGGVRARFWPKNGLKIWIFYATPI